MGDFANRVFNVVRQVPRGKVTTYGQEKTGTGV